MQFSIPGVRISLCALSAVVSLLAALSITSRVYDKGKNKTRQDKNSSTHLCLRLSKCYDANL